jgi:hypothetical protein
MQSFITQDPRDRDFLVNNLRNFDVPVLNYTGRDSRQREPPPEISPDASSVQQLCFISI